MNPHKEEEIREVGEAQEEALSEAEAPGQVVDPLAEPVGSRGTQRQVVTQFDEEDARERPFEDGIDPEIPEDEKLQVSAPPSWQNDLEDIASVQGEGDGIVKDGMPDVTRDPVSPEEIE